MVPRQKIPRMTPKIRICYKHGWSFSFPKNQPTLMHMYIVHKEKPVFFGVFSVWVRQYQKHKITRAKTIHILKWKRGPQITKYSIVLWIWDMRFPCVIFHLLFSVYFRCLCSRLLSPPLFLLYVCLMDSVETILYDQTRLQMNTWLTPLFNVA